MFDTYQPNTTVSQSDDNGGDNQKWLIYAVENNRLCLKSRSNGLALSVANGKAENGTDRQSENNRQNLEY
ncbi:MAG: RICIN domain-containing protein [Ruminococcus sp.]|nr:RICIN domain-containing protein [Ruminococcus sp.]